MTLRQYLPTSRAPNIRDGCEGDDYTRSTPAPGKDGNSLGQRSKASVHNGMTRQAYASSAPLALAILLLITLLAAPHESMPTLLTQARSSPPEKNDIFKPSFKNEASSPHESTFGDVQIQRTEEYVYFLKSPPKQCGL